MQEYESCAQEKTIASSSLAPVFGSKANFQQLLDDRTPGALERAIEQFTQWAADLTARWPQSSSGPVWRSTADTADSCCEATDKLMEDESWPFTKVIRVFLDAEVLKTGVVLADLPGLYSWLFN